MQKKILIDIKHPAQLNLFKGLTIALKKLNWDITICYLKRGKIPKIIEREFQGFNTIPVGSSEGTKWSIFWQGNVKRTTTFLHLIRKNRYNICVAASSAPLALACKLTQTPVIQFYDDPERKRITQINALLSTQLYFPFIEHESKKISHFNCLKEWSYLSPTYFKPNIESLDAYDLQPNNYIFIREVSNKSFNYYGQEDAIILGFAEKINPQIKVILSLEDKSIKDKYPKNWTVLEEPVNDIHSLIYYSKLVISSGDSMAREGAMLGVPSIYCGIREMSANNVLIEKGKLSHFAGHLAINPINQMVDLKGNELEQRSFREKLVQDWDDMIQFMVEKVNHFSKKR
ncbi:MAG: DUF354 domain-containing protein [Chitinophagales bacterium]|nr:DUF354 domain-containing protein [Chitinophagales bacterium]